MTGVDSGSQFKYLAGQQSWISSDLEKIIVALALTNNLTANPSYESFVSLDRGKSFAAFLGLTGGSNFFYGSGDPILVPAPTPVVGECSPPGGFPNPDCSISKYLEQQGQSLLTIGLPAGWPSVVSADGKKIFTELLSGKANISLDGGKTWITSHTVPKIYRLGSYADGNKLIAIDEHNSAPITLKIVTSSDAGITWINRYDVISHATPYRQTPGNSLWGDSLVASSADGKVLYVTLGTFMFVSRDSGSTWSQRNSWPIRSYQWYWRKLSTSSDGRVAVAYEYVPNGVSLLWFTTDYGVTWSAPPDQKRDNALNMGICPQDRGINEYKVSGDGTRLVGFSVSNWQEGCSKGGIQEYPAQLYSISIPHDLIAPTPPSSLSKPQLVSIICIKGRTTKNVKGINPTCPLGFKKS